MNTFKFAITSLKRDWYSGELRLIGLSILIAIACLSSVNFFTDRVRKATEQQATELLAADLVLTSSSPISNHYLQQAHNLELNYSLNESFRSVVIANDRLELAEVKAVDENYPLRGKLKITDALFTEPYETSTVPSVGSAWLDSRLLQALNIQLGDSINMGSSKLVVTKILNYEPDRGGDLFNIAPRLLMNRADLEQTGLILPGSRVRYKLLLGGNSDSIERYRSQLKTDESENVHIQGIKDARPEIRTALERAEQFLGLAALVSIALAGLAIAMSSQRYARRHYDNCAILRCLGVQQRQISQIYLFQLLLLAISAGLIACLVGFVAQEGLNILMTGMTQQSLPAPSIFPVFTGLFASLITVLGFALPQIIRLRNVSPLRVLRRDLRPLPLNNYLIYITAVLALMLLSPWQSTDIKITFYTLSGLFLTAFVLGGCANLMIQFLKNIQPRLKIAARYGLANVTRRSNQSMLQVVGIGIGITVMLLLTLVRTDLLESWQNRLPENTPNYFLINIQPDQINSVQSYLTQSLNKEAELYPMIRGRLIKINNIPVDIERYKNPRAKHLASREFNLSYSESMQKDNRLVSGIWWPEDRRNKNYFSVEEGIAKTLGIKQGDTLTYLIAGQELEGDVINLRWVEWDSFNVNFFVVANPEALASYPGTFISSFYIPDSKRSLLIDLVKQFPSITIFDVDAILKQVRIIMQQVVHTVEFVFIFTLLTGIAVLFAALQSTHDERLYESALMSALGASRKQIISGLVAEFLFLGLVTGILAAFAASIIEMVLAKFVFKIDIVIDPLLWVVGPVICCLIIVLTGLYGTRQVLLSSPMAVLRRA